MKRLIDLVFSFVGLVVSAPVLLLAMLLIWLQDFRSPLYVAPRVGRDGRMFRMVKLRSMLINADRSGVDSTSSTDSRITSIGSVIRRYKLDEFGQLWNVLVGDMSLVGPRPQVRRATDNYSEAEKKLLSVRPGVTDFSSIVFSDEGEILAGAENSDLAYEQLIRPWKSRLGLFYIQHRSVGLDLRLIFLTAVAIVNRRTALVRVQRVLRKMGASEELVRIAGRSERLIPHPPPGMTTVVTSRG